jgi:hypothetical protein
LGKSLLPLLDNDHDIRDAAIFGYFGAACNVTDGRYVYHRYPEKLTAEGLYEYTLMPTRMTTRFSISELVGATLATPFDFSKGVPLLKLKPRANEAGETIEVQGMDFADTQTRLYDLHSDPDQTTPIDNPEVEAWLVAAMVRLMVEADAPHELFTRFDLPLEGA